MAPQIASAPPLTNAEYDRVLRRYSSLDTEASAWITQWQEISRFLMPVSGRFMATDRNRGQKNYNDIYDSSASQALDVLGAGMMSGATSPARPWFSLTPGDRRLLDSTAVQEWLFDVRQIMLDVFNKSNTYRALQMKYVESGAFGTAASILMDDFETVIYDYVMTIGEYRLGTDYRGVVNTMGRKFQKTVNQLVKEFGLTNCSSHVQNLYDRGTYDAYITVIHLIQPREMFDSTKADDINMPFQSVYIEEGIDVTKTLRNSGMKQFRVLAPRWRRVSGDVYGIGPGLTAIGDIKQLQHEQLRKANAIDYMSNPPIQVPVSMKGKEVNRLPGGVSYYDSVSGPNAGIKTAFDVDLRIDHLLLDIQDVRTRIDAAFFKDIFLMISTNVNGPQQTATEIAEKHEEKMLMLGPVLENLHHEELRPRVEMTFQRIIEAGMIPPPPPELEGQELDIEFVSVLAQAQRAVATGSIDKFIFHLGEIATLKPEVLDKLDVDKWVDGYSQMLGVPPELIVAGPQVALIRKARVEQAQKEAAMEQVVAGAEVANKLGNAPTNTDNALTSVMDGLQGFT